MPDKMYRGLVLVQQSEGIKLGFVSLKLSEVLWR